MKKLALVGALLVGGCTAPDLPSLNAPNIKEKISAIPRAGFVVPAGRSAYVKVLDDMAARRPQPLSFRDMQICDAAELVFGQSLGLSASCSGSGSLSLVSGATEPGDLVDLFGIAVRDLGGKMALTDGAFSITGVADENRSGNALHSAVAPPDPATAPSASSVGYSLEGVPGQYFDKLGDAALQGRRLTSVFVPRVADAQELADLAHSLGLNVDVFLATGGAFAVGSSEDVAALRATSRTGDRVFTSIPASDMSQEQVDALAVVFPDVALAYDGSASALRISGEEVDVSDVASSLRNTLPAERNVKLVARFLTVTSSTLDRIDASFGGVVGDGNAGVVIGSVAYSRLLLLLDADNTAGAGVSDLTANLLVTSGDTGTYRNGSAVPVVTDVDEEGRQSLEYQETGLRFEASPRVARGGVVNLAFTVSVSSADSASDGNPVIERSEINSTVDVRQGDVVIVGGLNSLVDLASASKSPFILRKKTRANQSLRSLFVIEVQSVY